MTKRNKFLFVTAFATATTALVVPAALADSRSGYVGCNSSSFIQLQHQNSAYSDFQHKVDGQSYNNGFSNVGLTYTPVRNGSWQILTTSGSIINHSASCY